MEISEFIDVTTKMENFFEKELTKFQRDEWYKEFKNIPVSRYRQIINQTFRQCKFMPKLADLVSINTELPYNTNNNIIKEKVECNKCKGKGVIQYFKEVDNGNSKMKYEHYAKCECANGNDFNYDGTMISDNRNKSKFYIPTMQQINLY